MEWMFKKLELQRRKCEKVSLQTRIIEQYSQMEQL